MKFFPKKVNQLDCTLRDGGYYNNWKFSTQLTNAYLKTLGEIDIKFVEIGFRQFKSNIVLGHNAYSSNNFINDLKIPKNINIGIMVNAGDLLFNKMIIKDYKKLFQKNKKIKFVRIACHIHEVFLISKVIKFLQSQKISVVINLMQISEIEEKKLKKILSFLKIKKVKIFYIADSLGCLYPDDIKKIIRFIKKNWSGEIGIHAHNNLNLALENTKTAINEGAKWIDSTVTGMGRGPGNTKTEDLIKIFSEKKSSMKLENLIKKFFLPLKKKYKWGPNKYYNLSARNKIHPTFIQEILSEKNLKNKDILKIINYLKKSNSKKYNPNILNNFHTFKSKSTSKSTFLPNQFFNNKDVLIIGNNNSLNKDKIKISNLINKKKIFCISINKNKFINENLINMIVLAHPLRFMSQINLLRTFKNSLVFPYSFLESNNSNNKIITNKSYNYELNLNRSGKIQVSHKKCSLPILLGIGYAISLVISRKCKNIYLSGINISNLKNRFDYSRELIQEFKKKFKNVSIKSI